MDDTSEEEPLIATAEDLDGAMPAVTATMCYLKWLMPLGTTFLVVFTAFNTTALVMNTCLLWSHLPPEGVQQRQKASGLKQISIVTN
ncbi:hypothetical protein FHG87_022307 [Trinorchestia longiramus]|nr:hypothetical protein FHG87_022307 [Trinorchestia longiramus]